MHSHKLANGDFDYCVTFVEVNKIWLRGEAKGYVSFCIGT